MTTKSLAHKFTSAVADDANTGHVRPSNWNADHNFFLGVNAQTGASYTFVDGDDWCLVSFSNGSAIAATLPQANSGTFVSGWICFVRNLGAGTVTITPTTSTIDGAATLALLSGHSAIIVSDGTNYTTLPMANLPIIVASGKTITLNNSLTLAGTDGTTMTFPSGSGAVLTADSTATLTNKTFDTAGTGNSFSINGVAATANTGTGPVARASSPAFTTPSLGVATATSINKVAITAPATSATLTIADGKTLTVSNSGTLAGGDAFTLAIAANKTLTVSNSITLAGTDATTMTFPGASDTLAGLATAQTFTKQNIFNEATTVASASGAALDDVKVSAATTTITGTTTITRLAKVGLYQPTIDKPSGAVTVTDAATLYIDNAPVATNAATITNAWALLVGAGQSKFGDAISVTKITASALHGVTVTNTSAGSGNTYCDFEASNGTATAQFGVVGTNYTTLGALVANDAFMLGITGNVTIMALTGSTTIKLAAGGSAAIVTVSSAGVTIAGTLSLPTTINLTTNGANTGIYWNDAATKSAIYISAGLNINFSPDNPQLILRYSGTELARLTSNGYLGVGQPTPLTFLHLKGANVSNRGQLTLEASDYAQITLYGGATTSTNMGTQFYFDVANHNTIISAYNGTSAALGTMTINSSTLTLSGNLTVSPTSGSAFNVGGSGLSFALASITFSQVTNWGLAINNSNSANGATFVEYMAGGTGIATVTNNNNTGVTYSNISDRHLKEDESLFTRATEIINAARIYDYRWKGHKHRSVGPFAQELYEITKDVQPGLVTPPSGDKDRWKWADHLFVPILIAGQQDANRRIDDHERRLARLEQMRLAA